MGWQCVRGDLDYPQQTFRERFRDVILMDKLRDAIRWINRDDDGNPYLDNVTIDRAIRELLTTTAFGVFDKNRELTDKLIRGVSVEPADGSGESGQRSVPVKFIEFDPEHLDRNEFLAINQFRVDFIGRTGFVIPDIVLFVNGIPVAVIECKSPNITEPMQAGIDQLLRYSNNRPEVEEIEGVDQLFLFNQLIISTWFYEARVGTRLRMWIPFADCEPDNREALDAAVRMLGLELHPSPERWAGYVALDQVRRGSFRPIPVQEIGLYESLYRASWPVQTTPVPVPDWRPAPCP